MSYGETSYSEAPYAGAIGSLDAAVWWWNGTARIKANTLGWWDGTTLQPLEHVQEWVDAGGTRHPLKRG